METGIGARIRLARNLSDLSQQHLAERAGVSKMAISRYENGSLTPSSGVLLAIADALEQPTEFFLRGPVEVKVEPVYRRRKTQTAKSEARVLAQLTDWLERYLTIESLYPDSARAEFEFPDQFPFLVRNMDDVEIAAETLREEWDYGEEPIENLLQSLEYRGIRVGTVAGDEKFDACLFSLGDSKPVMAVKADVPGDRQRFSLAHELGHLMLLVEGDLECEAAANRFAGAFLVPRERIRRALMGGSNSITIETLYKLKHDFGMSMKAWVYRTKDLGYITDFYAETLYRQLSTLTTNRREPGRQVRSERPRRFIYLVEIAMNEQAISEERAKELLGPDWLVFQEENHDVHGKSSSMRD